MEDVAKLLVAILALHKLKLEERNLSSLELGLADLHMKIKDNGLMVIEIAFYPQNIISLILNTNLELDKVAAESMLHMKVVGHQDLVA